MEDHGESVVSGRTLEDVRLGRAACKPPERKNLGSLPGARKAPMPRAVPLTLASLSDNPFSNPDWLFEVKWDGVRGLAYLSDGEVSVRSRTGREIAPEYPEVGDLANQLDAGEAVVDGEIVALDESGRSNFQKLQSRSGVRNPSRTLLQTIPAIYYAFDLLYCDGYDLRKTPLEQRKNLLRTILRPNAHIRYSEHEVEKGKELYEAARQQGLEGIIGKKRDSVYAGQRTLSWLKLKIVDELDAVVCGWTAPRRSREFFGALVLGLYNGPDLEFIGSLGTGFDHAAQKKIYDQLKKLRQPKSPLSEVPKLKEAIEWVEPRLVARVKYGNWTDGNRLRAPVFLSLRDDLSPEECTVKAGRPNEARRVESKGKPARNGRWQEEVMVETPARKSKTVASDEKPRGVIGSPLKNASLATAAKSGETVVTKGVGEAIRKGSSEGLNVEVDGRVLG